MAPDTDTDAENDTVTVSEEKFNGTATLKVTGIDTKKQAKAFAREYFKEQHGTRVDRAVAERDQLYHREPRWTVVVSDHSSGSLVDAKEYDHPDTGDNE